MREKRVVIYTRFSSDIQRPESCDDQERKVREALTKLGIRHTDACCLRDEGESGTRSDRTAFQVLTAMVAQGVVAVLAVDDQSRLSRADNVAAFVTDLVFHEGRFLSTGEGITPCGRVGRCS